MTESLRLMRDKHVTQSKVQYRNWNFESVTTESYKSFNTGINLLAALHVSARLAQSRATSTHVLNMPSVKTAQDMGWESVYVWPAAPRCLLPVDVKA